MGRGGEGGVLRVLRLQESQASQGRKYPSVTRKRGNHAGITFLQTSYRKSMLRFPLGGERGGERREEGRGKRGEGGGEGRLF